MTPKDHANKFLCKICNIWIADNKPQRDQHEAGQKHKTAKVRLLKEIAKKNEASHREAGQPMLANTAAQQMLEAAAVATKVTCATEDVGEDEILSKERVDEEGFPLPADQVYEWGDVDTGAESARYDYITADALGEFAPDVEKKPVKDDHKETSHANITEGKAVGMPVPIVKEKEDAEERKKLENAFKKRAAPKNRRKRRAR